MTFTAVADRLVAVVFADVAEERLLVLMPLLPTDGAGRVLITDGGIRGTGGGGDRDDRGIPPIMLGGGALMLGVEADRLRKGIPWPDGEEEDVAEPGPLFLKNG